MIIKTASLCPSIALILVGLSLAGPLDGAAEPAAVAVPVPAQSDLKALYARAPNLTVERLCEGVKTVRISDRFLIPNPDGKTYDLLQLYFKDYGGPNTIVIADLGTGKVKTLNTGKRSVGFHMAVDVLAPDGKLYLSVMGEAHHEVCVYDPATDTFTLNAIAGMPATLTGETHPMVLGPDNMIYCAGTHPSMSVTAVQIDPTTQQVTEYGPIGPSHAPAHCWAYSMGADDRYLYIASGKTPWYLVAFDRQTRTSEVLLTHDVAGGYLGVDRPAGGVTCFTRIKHADGSFTDTHYWLYQGKAIPQGGEHASAPWPASAPAPARPPVPEFSNMALAPDVNGEAVIWYRLPADKASATAAALVLPDAPASEEDAPPALPSDDAMRAAGWRDIRYPVEMYALRIDRLFELPDGRLMGTAGHYLGNFLYDPGTGKGVHPGKIGLSHYATAIHDGKVYMSGYPNGPLYVYDPARPWTANRALDASRWVRETDPESNPRRLNNFGAAGAKKMLAGVAANGKVYFGGMWMREGAWGGLGWLNVAEGKEYGVWKPFSTAQIRYLAATDEGRVLVLSTTPVGNILLQLPQPDEAALYFWDTTTDAAHPETLVPVPKARHTGPVVAVGGSRVIGWTENPENPKESSILYVVDARTRKVVMQRDLPFPVSMGLTGDQREDSDFRLGPDGRIWTFLNWKLARIHPDDLAVEFLGATGDGGRLAFSGNDVYIAGNEVLRCVRGIVGK